MLLHFGSQVEQYYSADLFMHFTFIDCIVKLAHAKKLDTVKDVVE